MAVSYGLCSSGILQAGRNCRRLYRVSVYTGDELYVYVGEWKPENDEVQFIMGYVKGGMPNGKEKVLCSQTWEDYRDIRVVG